MKKILSLFIVMVLVLVGCSSEGNDNATGAVAKLKEKTAFLKDAEFYEMKISMDESDELEITYNTKVDGSVSAMEIYGIKVYMDSEYTYSDIMGWTKVKIAEEDKAELSETTYAIDFIKELANLSADTELDYEEYPELKGKKINDILVEESDNVFTFKGYEDKFTIDATTKDLIVLKALDAEIGVTSIIKIKVGEEVVIPKEALEAEETIE